MPRKIRELIAELQKAGWRNTSSAKGSHRKFAHPDSSRKIILSERCGYSSLPGKGREDRRPRGAKMKADYLKFVQWSVADRLFVGYCPDLFIGGVCHGSDEQKVYRELSRTVSDEIGESERGRRALPAKRALVTVPVAV